MDSHHVEVQLYMQRFVRFLSGEIPEVLNRLEVILAIYPRILVTNSGGYRFLDTFCAA